LKREDLEEGSHLLEGSTCVRARMEKKSKKGKNGILVGGRVSGTHGKILEYYLQNKYG